MRKPKIAVAGSMNVDITAYAPRLPLNGETVFGSSVALGAGGKGFNQATAAKRSGGDVLMIAKIGDDALSSFALEQLKTEGMRSDFITVVPGVNTGCALIEVSENGGENRIIAVNGANATLTASDIKAAESAIAECDIALAQFETNFEATEAFIDICRAHNIPVIINPAPFLKAPDGFYVKVDMATPNETEAEQISGVKIIDDASARRAADSILALGVKRVIITLGAKGVYYTDGKTSCFAETAKVKAVDTTGAGDAFNGALAYMLADNADMERAIRYANCYAALSVTRKGACAALPTAEQTLEFMKTINMCLY